MNDTPLDGMPFIEPSPDEEAWEAFLTLALTEIGGNDANGLSNAQLGELEGAVGEQLPFELGLLLIMGVPDGESWWHWADPAADVAQWTDQMRSGVLFDVQHNDTWLDSWGVRPDDGATALDVATAAFDSAPPLLPIMGHRAMPLTVARDEESTAANPVLSIVQTDVITYGTDLAAWLHREFEVPLPMWPETARRWFPFWSEFAEL